MINNKELIKPLLIFPHKDSFYFIQILQRKKDYKDKSVGGSNSNSRLIKAYYISSVEQLETYWEEMIKLAEVFNARVCINLNPRSFEKAAFQLLIKVANQMHNKDFYNVRKAYDAICGEYHHEMDRRWIVDVDKEDMGRLEEIEKFISGLHSLINNKDYNILAKMPSKTGMHIICNPFNLETFSYHYPTISVHKNNPTSLFIV